MESIKQEYINKTYNALINYQQNLKAQRDRFENANYGINTPVDAK